jgi:predicted sulfurtransferase
LEQVPHARHWQGRCFVFDARATLGTDLEPAPVADVDRTPAVQNPGTS